MKVEMYKNEVIVGDESLRLTEATMLKEQAKLCEKAGLDRQAGFFEEAAKELLGEIPFRKLTIKEYEQLRAFLPTEYSSMRKFDTRSISQYNFDRVPSDVVAILADCTDKNMFLSYSILTPEKKKVDPVLIGETAYSVYLLARWGESLIPFKKMLAIGRRRKLIIDTLPVLYGVAVLVMIIGFIFVALHTK